MQQKIRAALCPSGQRWVFMQWLPLVTCFPPKPPKSPPLPLEAFLSLTEGICIHVLPLQG